MPITLLCLQLAGVTIIIVTASHFLAKSADIIAYKSGLGQSLVGVLLLATATSLPELGTGVSSVTFLDAPDLAAGDAFGSNLFNLLIIGLLDIFWWRGPILTVVSTTTVLVGVLGIGNIGRQVARRVQGFDARVQYYDLFPLSDEQERELDVTRVGLEELFKTSDIITCHTPLTPDTRHIVNAEMLALMKSSAVIINTSRGPVVDEAALIEALQEGRIAGAGLDVFAQEPVDPNNPLLKMDNVVVSPHSAGTTWNTWFRRAEFAYRNMNGVWNGDAPMAVAQDYE